MELTTEHIDMAKAAEWPASFIDNDEPGPMKTYKIVALNSHRNLLSAAQEALEAFLENEEISPLKDGSTFTVGIGESDHTRGIQIRVEDNKLIGQLVRIKHHTPDHDITDPTGQIVTRRVLSESRDALDNVQRAKMNFSILLKSLSYGY